MHDPTFRPGIRARIAAIAAGAALVASILPMTVAPVAAAATLNQATGGTAISADSVGGTYTTLTGPSITLTGAADLTTGTIVFTAPSGFGFNTAATIGATGAGVIITCPTITTSTITCGVDHAATSEGTVLFTGVQVRPTAGTPLASGNITASGTALVSGNAGTLTEIAGVATDLLFTTEPGGAAPDELLSPQPVVTVVDQFDNRVLTSTAQVTLAIWAGPSSGALSGTNPRNAVAGRATFTNLSIDTAGTGYTLRATSPGLTGDVSATFNITSGAATRVTFQGTFGTPGTAGALLPNSGAGLGVVEVAVTDSSGNIITGGASRSITLALAGAPATGGNPSGNNTSTLTCNGLILTTVNGVATFQNCRIAWSGQAYQLIATSSNLTSDTTEFFDINPVGAATQLAFRVQPGGGVAGVAWGQQPVVEARDYLGNLVFGTTRTVALQIGSNPGTGTLTCTGGMSISTVNGRAVFSGCSINKIATGYTLVATSSGLTSATSTTFNITAGTATKLTFTQQPGAPTGTAVTAGVAFPTQPHVAVTDAGGNVATGYPSIPVYITIATGPSGATLTCTGGNYAYTSSGTASFSGCSVSLPGTYTLAADDAATNSPNLAVGYSSSFTVAANAAQITLTAAPAPINLGASTTVTIQFASRGASRQVQIQAYNAVTRVFATLATVTTDSTGRAAFTTGALRYSTTFKAVFTGAADLSAGTSNTFIVGVRRSVTMVPSYTGYRSVTRGTRLTYGSLIGPLNGIAVPRGTFQIYKLIDGVWVFQTSATFATTSAGKATFSWTWNHSGNWYVRWRANSDAYNTTRFSPIAKVTVP